MYILTHIFASGLTTTYQQQLQENILKNSVDISDISDGADIQSPKPLSTINDSDILFVENAEFETSANSTQQQSQSATTTDQLKTKNLNQSPPKISHPDAIFEEPEKDDDEEEDHLKTNSNDKSQSKQKADNNLLTQPIKTQKTNIASINREKNNLAVAETTTADTSSLEQQQHIKPAIEVASNSSVQNSKIPDRKNASPEIKGN